MPPKILSPEALGHALKDARKATGKTQEEIGKLIGMDQGTVSIIERGNPGTRLETLFRLLAALDLEISLQPRSKPAGTTEGDQW
jgi:HTH-type transcriptional regulator / antitoxin HipB